VNTPIIVVYHHGFSNLKSRSPSRNLLSFYNKSFT
jgi:hypothetical protein